MLMPKKTKYRKMQRGNMRGLSKGARSIAFGTCGLQAIEPAWITAQQIEAMRVTISRHLKKEGKLYLRMFPDKSVSKKPAETRMGKGKGAPELWVFVARRGRILCELQGLPELEAKNVLRQAAYKLPVRTKIVMREGGMTSGS